MADNLVELYSSLLYHFSAGLSWLNIFQNLSLPPPSLTFSPSTKFLLEGTVPSTKFFLDSTVPSTKFLLDGTVPATKHNLNGIKILLFLGFLCDQLNFVLI